MVAEFIVSGTAELGRESQPFEKEIEAESEKDAEDRVYSMFGSKHGISRANVRIESLEKA
ncbi:MAG: 50S ribosomal protein L18Ae [Candidatus Nanohaloarchaea archaeon]|nr:50S ribosomal protein L18Ae [Candidatus Nanohaloarchaea archaeon]